MGIFLFVFFYPIFSTFLLAIFVWSDDNKNRYLIQHFVGILVVTLTSYFFGIDSEQNLLIRITRATLVMYVIAIGIAAAFSFFNKERSKRKNSFAREFFITWTSLSLMSVVFVT